MPNTPLCLSQFLTPSGPFDGEERPSGSKERNGEIDQAIKRRDRPRGDDIEAVPEWPLRHFLDPRVVHLGIDAEKRSCRLKERGLLPRGLDEMNLQVASDDRDDETGQPTSGTDVNDPCIPRKTLGEPHGLGDVPFLQFLQSRATHQVVGTGPYCRCIPPQLCSEVGF